MSREADRNGTVDTPRVGTNATLASSAPCTPPGLELIGWTNANTPDANPVNAIHLYALWGRKAA